MMQRRKLIICHATAQNITRVAAAGGRVLNLAENQKQLA
jgi:hypothetical protein